MMNWQKKRNYRKLKNDEDETIRYIVIEDGEELEVDEAFFTAYSQSDRRERYVEERDAGRLLSLDQMYEDNVMLSYFMDVRVESVEDTVIRRDLGERAMRALVSLREDERNMLQALIIDGVTERAYAARIARSQKYVNIHKQKYLEKLKIIVLKP